MNLSETSPVYGDLQPNYWGSVFSRRQKAKRGGRQTIPALQSATIRSKWARQEVSFCCLTSDCPSRFLAALRAAFRQRPDRSGN